MKSNEILYKGILNRLQVHEAHVRPIQASPYGPTSLGRGNDFRLAQGMFVEHVGTAISDDRLKGLAADIDQDGQRQNTFKLPGEPDQAFSASQNTHKGRGDVCTSSDTMRQGSSSDLSKAHIASLDYDIEDSEHQTSS